MEKLQTPIEKLKNCDDLYVHELGDFLTKFVNPRKLKIGKSERLCYYWLRNGRPISIADLKKILDDNKLNILLKQIKFISAYSSPHVIALPNEIGPELAYLGGYHLGDGSISKDGLTIHYMDSKGQLDKISKIYQNLFGVSLVIKKDCRSKAFNATITSKALSLFFHHCLDFSIGKKELLNFPEWLPDSLKKDFIVGFLDAEFGVTRKKFQFSGSTIDKNFMLILQKELKKCGLDLIFYGPYKCLEDLNPRWFLKSSKIDVMYNLLENGFVRHPNHLKILKTHINNRAPVV